MPMRELRGWLSGYPLPHLDQFGFKGRNLHVYMAAMGASLFAAHERRQEDIELVDETIDSFKLFAQLRIAIHEEAIETIGLLDQGSRRRWELR